MAPNKMTPNYYDSAALPKFTSGTRQVDKFSMIDDMNHSIDITVPTNELRNSSGR